MAVEPDVPVAAPAGEAPPPAPVAAEPAPVATPTAGTGGAARHRTPACSSAVADATATATAIATAAAPDSARAASAPTAAGRAAAAPGRAATARDPARRRRRSADHGPARAAARPGSASAAARSTAAPLNRPALQSTEARRERRYGRRSRRGHPALAALPPAPNERRAPFAPASEVDAGRRGDPFAVQKGAGSGMQSSGAPSDRAARAVCPPTAVRGPRSCCGGGRTSAGAPAFYPLRRSTTRARRSRAGRARTTRRCRARG